ncbi:MAG: GNAT family N-acetyltransferase, partial [Bacteroidales bacterium]|nr:GNAT family N-acetyltransferase [Bacteroidales bacterium]
EHQVLEMWRICFGDSQPYFDIYFRERYKNENTLAYFVEDKVVASLQLLHYNFTYCNTEIPIAYISGACTLPEARKKGYMEALLKRAFKEIAKRNVPLSLLVPEEDWLFSFYDKYGYAKTFDAGSELLSLENLMKRHSNDLHAAYIEFDSLYRNQEMTVQKTFDDFRVVVEETAGYDFPLKKSLAGMARVIDTRQMLELFAKQYPEKSFSIEVTDDILPQNNLFLSIDDGHVSDTDVKHAIHHLQLNIYELAQALLGYKTSKKEELFKGVFPEHQPQIHFMME